MSLDWKLDKTVDQNWIDNHGGEIEQVVFFTLFAGPLGKDTLDAKKFYTRAVHAFSLSGGGKPPFSWDTVVALAGRLSTNASKVTDTEFRRRMDTRADELATHYINHYPDKNAQTDFAEMREKQS